MSTPTINKDSRIHTHSHIKGLGLSPEGRALPIGQGFVGQAQAREALGLHLGLLRSGKYSGRPLLLVGPPGTGKVSRSGGVFFLEGCVWMERREGC
jgi:RuvB-like protein 1 (pontin 52)